MDQNIKKTCIGNNRYYFYYHYNLKKNEKIAIPENANCTIFILNCNKNSKIKLNNRLIKIKKHSCIYLKKYNRLDTLESSIEILLIGKKHYNIQNYILKKKFNFYKVNKPWGYELWINSLNTDFAFKKIYIKSGFKLVFNFINIKRNKSNILWSG